jgi:hypothetical protein
MKQDLSQHVSNEQLLDRLYGLSENAVPHLRGCSECSGRLEALERRRSEVVAAGPVKEAAVTNDFLLAQRRAIYARLDRRSGFQTRLAPAALATAFLLVTGVFLARPHPVYRPLVSVNPASVAVAEEQSAEPGADQNTAERLGVGRNDEQLFSDLYSMEQSVEPRAAAPIHALFEASAGNTVQ